MFLPAQDMTHVSVVVVGEDDTTVRVVDSSTPTSRMGDKDGGGGIVTNGGGAELSDLSRSLSTTSSQGRTDSCHHTVRGQQQAWNLILRRH